MRGCGGPREKLLGSPETGNIRASVAGRKEGSKAVSIAQMRKLSLRAFKGLVRGHTARRWQSEEGMGQTSLTFQLDPTQTYPASEWRLRPTAPPG